MKKNTQLLLITLFSCAACNSYSMKPAIVDKVTLARTAKQDDEARINATVIAAPAAAAGAKPSAPLSPDQQTKKRELLCCLLSLVPPMTQDTALNALTLLNQGDPDNDKLAQKVVETVAAIKAQEDKKKKEHDDALQVMVQIAMKTERLIGEAQNALQIARSILKDPPTDSNTAPK